MASEGQKDIVARLLTEDISPNALKLIIVTLFALVFLSLGLNWVLISQLLSARQQALDLVQDFKPVARDALSLADAELKSFQESTLEFSIEMGKETPFHVPIAIEVGRTDLVKHIERLREGIARVDASLDQMIPDAKQ